MKIQKQEDEENSEIKEAFDLFDTDKKGIINIPETLESLKIMQMDETDPDLYDLISSFGNTDINYQQFKQKFEELLTDKEQDQGYQRLYDLFLENPYKDEIDLETLRKTCKKLKEDFKDIDLQYILDTAGDGNKISFSQFKKFMEKKYGNNMMK